MEAMITIRQRIWLQGNCWKVMVTYTWKISRVRRGLGIKNFRIIILCRMSKWGTIKDGLLKRIRTSLSWFKQFRRYMGKKLSSSTLELIINKGHPYAFFISALLACECAMLLVSFTLLPPLSPTTTLSLKVSFSH